MSKLTVKRYDSAKKARNARTKAKVVNVLIPRLTVFRSNKYIYAQVINQAEGKSVAGVRGKNPEEVGKKIAAKAVKLGVTAVVFDRGAYQYHGRVKKLAESAREGGLKF